MIHISPGHEKSISLEVFFKAFKILPQKSQSLFTLHIRKKELLSFLKDYQIFYRLKENQIQIGSDIINLIFFQESSKSFSQEGLESALNHLNPAKDILVTLPISKDSLVVDQKIIPGHTEYFRQRYHRPHLTMAFKNKKRIFLLLTDHIPLKDVSKQLTAELIEKKITLSLKQIEAFYGRPDEIYLSGINPHAGEQGLLGLEEKRFSSFLFLSKVHFPPIAYIFISKVNIKYLFMLFTIKL